MILKIFLSVFGVIYKFASIIKSIIKSVSKYIGIEHYPNYGLKDFFPFGHFRCFKLSSPIRDVPVMAYILETFMGLSSIFREEGLISLNVLNEKHVFVYDPEIIKVLLTNTKEVNKSDVYKFIRIFLGNGLLTSSKELWKKQKKLMNPMFQLQNIKELVPMMNTHTKNVVAQFRRILNESDNAIIEISKPIFRAMFYLITDAVFDQNDEKFQEKLFNSFNKIEESFGYRTLRPWISSDRIFKMTKMGREVMEALKVMEEYFISQLNKKKMKMKESNSDVPKFHFMDIILDMLEKNPEVMTTQQLEDECYTIISAGFDTSATTSTFTLYLLGLYPEIQEKVYQELVAVLGTDIERDIEYNDLKHLTYLESVIKETLRLYPSIPLFGRRLTKDIQIGNVMLKKNVNCAIFIAGLHRDPRYFPNPEVFDPDRFNPENSTNRQPFCYLPFSSGVRNCIGQAFGMLEVKVLVVDILRNFRVTSQSHRDKIIMSFEVVAKVPKIYLHFEPRNKTS